jgi:hypothetical protein
MPLSNLIKLGWALVIIFLIVMSVIVALFMSGVGFHLHDTPVPFTTQIVKGDVTVPAGAYLDYQFTIPSDAQKNSVSLSLEFTAQGGDNDIKVYVLDSIDFSYYQNGQNYTSLYQSGRITTAGFSMNIPTNGTYYLVLDNKFSMTTPKNVNVQAAVSYFTPKSAGN